MRAQPVVDRFWRKVEFTDSCWLWTACVQPNGYGQFADARAHRWAYEFCVGPIPDGLQLDHLCRVRHCVNHDHLEAVTQRENILRGVGITAKCASKTAAPCGHPYTVSGSRGGRRCRSCRLAYLKQCHAVRYVPAAQQEEGT